MLRLSIGGTRRGMASSMTNDFWKKLFESFRPEDEKLLVVRTADGLEVAVQNLSRIEDGLVMIRGRIAGTPDNGRLFLLPYAQLTGVYVNRIVANEEVELFSPSASPERKMEVARVVAEIERKAREEAKSAELSKNAGDKPAEEALRKLEALREEGERSAPPPPAEAVPGRGPAPRQMPQPAPRSAVAAKGLPELARR